MIAGAMGTLQLEPGGVATLQWTSAWRGVLMMGGRRLQAPRPMHVHDYYSIGLVDRGEAEIQCGGETYHAGPGSVFLISPWEAHRETVVSAGGLTVRSLFPASGTMQRVLGMDGAALLGQLVFDRPVIENDALVDDLDELFTGLSHAPGGIVEGPITDRVRAGLLRQLRRKSTLKKSRGLRAVDAAQARLVRSRREMTSLAELSRLTGMSRYHLSRVFRDVTGLPPYAYFEQVRLARANVLLRKGMRLSEVAMTLGYSDQSHFHRQFREREATTPGRYARALRAVFCPTRRGDEGQHRNAIIPND